MQQKKKKQYQNILHYKTISMGIDTHMCILYA